MKNIIFKYLHVIIFTCLASAAFAQEPANANAKAKVVPTHAVTGKVVDAATGEVLAGAKIKAYNNSLFTAMTGEDGTFTINIPDYVKSLSTDLEGYVLNTEALNGRESGVVIRLFSDRYLADYTAKTTGNRTVSTSDFATSSLITVDQELQNRLGADIRSIQRSAIPGMGNAMFIGGYNSLNINAQPLIVLDGVIYDMMYDETMIHSGYYNNLLSAINIDDIEDVQVLKNGTAIYGAKAANGVILINTKRSKTMATRIDLNISGGFELTSKLPDVMNADEYRLYASELLGTTGSTLESFKFLQTDNSYPYYNRYHNNTDWKDVAYQEAWTQNYGIHVTGGDEVASYSLSVGYMNSEATLKNNDMERFNIRFNSDIKLLKNLSTSFDVSYTNITRNLRDDGLGLNYDKSPIASPSMLSLIKSPFVSPYAYDSQDCVSSFVADADDYLQEALGSGVSVANPLGILTYGDAVNKNHTDNTMINLSITPKWQATKNFSVQERFSYTMQNFDEAYYTPLTGMPSFTYEGKGVVENTKASMFAKHTAIMSDTRFDWAFPLDAHRVDLFGGVRFMNDTYTGSQLLGYNTGSDKTPNMSTSLAHRTEVGNEYDWKSLSYYLNADYNYMEKYYLQGQVSVETSSRYGQEADAGLGLFGVRWGVFPSIQGSWVITNEDWFHANNIVNMLKLNVGFESVGNDGVDNSATLTYMAASPMLANSVSTIGLGNIGNTKLRWETTNRFNAGLEGNFIGNRLNLRFNYFYSKTNHLLTLGKLAYVAGIDDYWTNDGSLKNNGFDVTATGKVVNLDKFKLELGASVGHYKNELVSLAQGKSQDTYDIYGGTILSKVGCPVGVFYGYKTNGVYATTAEANQDGLYIVNDKAQKVYFQGGDMRFVDLDGNKEINEDDRCIIGDPNPDIYGNIFANAFIGKHWTVSLRFNYSLGNDIYNFQRSLLESGEQFYNQTTAMKRRWVAEGQVTDMPRVCYTTNAQYVDNGRFSDRWIEDGSYLKLKNITVSYKLPITNQYIQGFTIWAAANDLFTITKYLGSDPEVSCGNGVLVQGIDTGYLPSGRSFHLGVKVNL